MVAGACGRREGAREEGEERKAYTFPGTQTSPPDVLSMRPAAETWRPCC